MWQKAPKNINLFENDIHIWRVNLNIDQGMEKSFLKTFSQKEHKRAARFRFQTHRKYFIAGRGILRELLGRYLRQAPKEIEFEYGEQGKPFLKKSKNDWLQFNLSHSGNQAVFTFAKNLTVGVDLEIFNPKIEISDIAPRFFSKNETDKLFTLTGEKQIEAFFNCWTRKEAFIKALGGGLSIPLDKFEMSFLPDEKPRLLAIDSTLGNLEDWSVFSFRPGKDSVGALAVKKAEMPQIKFFAL